MEKYVGGWRRRNYGWWDEECRREKMEVRIEEMEKEHGGAGEKYKKKEAGI